MSNGVQSAKKEKKALKKRGSEKRITFD